MTEERNAISALNTHHAKLFRDLYFNKTGILLLSMGLASIGLVLWSSQIHGSAEEILLGLGVAVLAASIYSTFQVLLTTKQFNDFLVENIRQATTEAIAKQGDLVLGEYRSIQQKYIPVATYPEADSPGPKFNRDLNESIRGSSHYTFYGLTARYALARLSMLGTAPRDIKIVMANPSQPDAVNIRARREASSTDDGEFEQKKAAIIHGIYMSIAGAFLTRWNFDRIVLCLTAYPPVDRAELCDSSVYIAYFSDPEETRAQFPSTMKFARASLIYQIIEHECNRMFASIYSNNIEIKGSTTEEEFRGKLGEAGVIITDEDWLCLTSDFKKFSADHRAELIPQ